MKRLFCIIMTFMMLFGAFAMTVSADETDPKFSYKLTVDGKEVKNVSQGDIINVVLQLNRTDAAEDYTMDSTQAEIRFDGEFFELVPESWFLSSGIKNGLRKDADGRHYEFYMNYVHMIPGGVIWKPETRIGTFQLKVKASTGVSVITNEDALVSKKGVDADGKGNYECDVNYITVKISDECAIKFHTGEDATQVPDILVKYGEKLPWIDPPKREGYYFAGWYKDISCTIPWDFENDVVEKNCTLYAKWSEEEIKLNVDFETNGGNKIDSITVNYGDKLEHVEHPKKDGYYFAGWYTDKEFTHMWDFEKDAVIKDLTLYAKWSKTPVKLPCQNESGSDWGWLILIIVFLLLFILIFIIVLLTKKVTFDSNGGTPVKTQRVFRKRKLRRPASPTKEGYTFVGWAKDAYCTTPWRFNTDKVEQSMTLYAKWKQE